MTCPKNLACLSLIVTHNFLPVSALLSTFSLVILSMYDHLCIFLRNHTSAALLAFTAAQSMVHDSLPYVSIGTMYHSNTLLRVSIGMCFFLKMVLRSWNAFLAWVILILISLTDLPLLAVRDPRHLKFSTYCNIESSSLTLHFGVSCFSEMTMVTVFLVFNPRSTAWLFSFMTLTCCGSFSDVAIRAMSSAYRRLPMVWPPIVVHERSPVSRISFTTLYHKPGSQHTVSESAETLPCEDAVYRPTLWRMLPIMSRNPANEYGPVS